MIAASLFAPPAHGQSATLTAVADATLIEDPAGGWANGSGVNLFAGRIMQSGGGTVRRALMRFDLSSLPPQAQVQSVSVRLVLTRSRFAGDLPATLHRVTQSWSEGPSDSSGGIGVPSVNGDVTWIHRTKPSLLWNQPGGDYVSTPSATRIVAAGGGPYVWASTPALVADVQQWLASPSTNHGWVLLGFEGSGTSAKAFAAREAPSAGDRPSITVTYTIAAADNDVPLPGWALVLLAAALAATLTRRDGRA